MSDIGHNGGPPMAPLTAKAKVERIKNILDRDDLTAMQKTTGVGLVVNADKDWVSLASTADLQRWSSARDRETVFRATKKLDDIGIVRKSNTRGQTGRYDIIPPNVIEAVVEAYDDLKSGRVEADHSPGQWSGGTRLVADQEPVGLKPTTSQKAVGLEPTSPMEPVGLKPTGRVEADHLASAPSRARIETTLRVVTPTEEDISPFYPPTDEPRVTFEKGRLSLCDALRTFWLQRFGDEELLDLALIQAAGYVQVNSSRPLEAQVSAQLARRAADKRDRDARYAAAVANKPKKKFKPSRWAD